MLPPFCLWTGLGKVHMCQFCEYPRKNPIYWPYYPIYKKAIFPFFTILSHSFHMIRLLFCRYSN